MIAENSIPMRRPRAPRMETQAAPRRLPHVIAVTSGKGGVGKTNMTANLAYQLRQMRKRVLILDADLGLANIDVILGLNTHYNLNHVFSGEKQLEEIVVKGPAGIRILPAGSGVQPAAHLSDSQKVSLLEQIERMVAEYDFLLIDTAAGLSDNVIYFNLAAQTTLVVVTPEPTSLTDAYAMIKVLSRDYHQRHFKVLANDVSADAEGLEVFQKLAAATDRFLSVSLDYVGCVPHDNALRQAVRLQRPFCEAYPDGPAAGAIRKLARAVSAMEHNALESDLGLLWRNMLTPAAGTSAEGGPKRAMA